MALSLVSLPRLLLLSNSRTSRAFELLLSLRHSVMLWWWSVIIMCCELTRPTLHLSTKSCLTAIPLITFVPKTNISDSANYEKKIKHSQTTLRRTRGRAPVKLLSDIINLPGLFPPGLDAVSYTHLTLPTRSTV